MFPFVRFILYNRAYKIQMFSFAERSIWVRKAPREGSDVAVFESHIFALLRKRVSRSRLASAVSADVWIHTTQEKNHDERLKQTLLNAK